jgi:hypothetical protein
MTGSTSTVRSPCGIGAASITSYRQSPYPKTSDRPCGRVDVRILDEDGELVRELTLDPTRDYQPIGRRRVSDVSRHPCTMSRDITGCGREDSNLHGSQSHRILNPARLPFRHARARYQRSTVNQVVPRRKKLLVKEILGGQRIVGVSSTCPRHG